MQGQLSFDEIERLAHSLLVDPVTETFTIEEQLIYQNTVEISFLPGVTDSVAENILKAAHHLGFESLEQAATGLRYESQVALETNALENLALSLANPVIQRFAINEAIQPPFFDRPTTWKPLIESIALQHVSDDSLLQIS